MPTFRDNFIAALDASGYSVRKLASVLEVSPSTVGHWRTGRAKPRMDRLELIAKELQTTVSALVAGDPDFAHTPLESAALQAFRGLTDAQQVAALQLMATIKSG